jgi:hypothetical protein
MASPHGLSKRTGIASSFSHVVASGGDTCMEAVPPRCLPGCFALSGIAVKHLFLFAASLPEMRGSLFLWSRSDNRWWRGTKLRRDPHESRMDRI